MERLEKTAKPDTQGSSATVLGEIMLAKISTVFAECRPLLWEVATNTQLDRDCLSTWVFHTIRISTHEANSSNFVQDRGRQKDEIQEAHYSMKR